MKRTIISILFLANIFINAQSALDMSKSITNNIKSPQVTDFIRYGNIPIKKNVGELDLSIPLLSIPTQDGNDINIGISYNSSGFIPGKNAGTVGFNWELITGGLITREVRGEADDQMGSPQTLDASGTIRHFEHGLIAGIKQFGTNTSLLPTDNDISNYNNSKMGPYLDDTSSTTYYEMRFDGYPNNNTTRFETTPDIFSFNFNGISGKFFMASNGKIEVTTTEPHFLKVDVTNLNSQPYISSCIPQYNSEIKITDEKGNEYYFGGESKNLEYSVFLGSNGNGNQFSPDNVPTINTWKLTKIIFPNGETVKYNYLNDKINFSSSAGGNYCFYEGSGFWHGSLYADTKKFLQLQAVPIQIKRLNSTYQETHTMSYSEFKSTSSSESFNYNYSLVKKTYLSSIEFKDYKVNFIYSDQDNLYKNISTLSSGNINSVYFDLKQKKLDKIELYNGLNFIKDVNFTYNSYNSNFPRIFLKQIQETGKSPYILNYDISNSGNTPNPLTLALDYWGFYNGKHSNEQVSPPVFIPKVRYYNTGEFEYLSDHREPNFEFSKMYALQSVKYPTGGTSNFLYEPHTYSLRLERKLSSEFLPSLFQVNNIAGGTRIKKIYDNEGNINQNIREFIYLNDENQSSGILLDWPRYYFYLNSQSSLVLCDPPGSNKCWASMDTTAFNGYIQSSTYAKNLFEGSVMSYSKVVEKQTDNGSITDYYTSYIDKPDTFFDNKRQLTAGSYTPSPATQNINLLPGDRSIERGKLSRRLIKDEANNLLEESIINYNEDVNRFNKFHFAIQHSIAWGNTTKNYFYNDFTSKTTTKKYLNNVFVKTETDYSYENLNHNMLTKSKVSFSDGTFQEMTYQYAYEKGNQLMISKNMIGIPLETMATQNAGNATSVLSKMETIYPKTTAEITNNNANLVLPLSVKSYDIKDVNTNVNPPASNIDVLYDKYDAKGNLQQYTTRDGVSTTLVWGYNGTQPIAKIEGAKLSDITPSLIDAIVVASDTDNSAAPNNDETSFLLALDTFRKTGSLLNFQITTYTYDPLIGVRSLTPPSGIREVYIYDTANRLKEVRENNATGNLLKEFKYNYKN